MVFIPFPIGAHNVNMHVTVNYKQYAFKYYTRESGAMLYSSHNYTLKLTCSRYTTKHFENNNLFICLFCCNELFDLRHQCNPILFSVGRMTKEKKTP